MRKIFLIGLKDLRLAFRDRAALLLMLVAPFLLTLGLGFVTGRSPAASSGLEQIPVVVGEPGRGRAGPGAGGGVPVCRAGRPAGTQPARRPGSRPPPGGCRPDRGGGDHPAGLQRQHHARRPAGRQRRGGADRAVCQPLPPDQCRDYSNHRGGVRRPGGDRPHRRETALTQLVSSGRIPAARPRQHWRRIGANASDAARKCQRRRRAAAITIHNARPRTKRPSSTSWRTWPPAWR